MGSVSACPRCGWQVEAGWEMCPNCGQSLVGGGAAATPTPPEPYPGAGTSGPYAVPQQPYAPPYGYAPQAPAPAKSRTGLIVGALVVVGLIALVVAAVLVALLIGSGRDGGPNVQIGEGTPAPVNTGGSGGVRGRVGDRVESAGLAITVIEVLDSPDPSVASILDLQEGQQYIACDVLLENNTGYNIFYTGATFKLRDKYSYEYEQVPLNYRHPELDFGTMSNREQVRGYVDFLISSDNTGLSLIYQNGGVPGYETIYIDLGR